VASALNETFRMAPAAGGIVVKDGTFVSIVRHDIPDLPKGHIEKGETPEVAALREVEEETGIGKLHIINELPSTWHCYLEHEEWKLKRTYWYLMESEECIQAEPQTEEGITEIKLIGNEEVEYFLKNTFRSISEILGGDLRQIVAK
jgi:8-oxo-dGTP pyrophosphatase MutT (NUDIX family)